MRYRLSLPFILLAFNLGCSCQSNPPANPQPVPEAKPMLSLDTDWQVTELQGKPVLATSPDYQPLTLRLNSADGRVTGYTGINQFNGGYEMHGDSLKFGPAATTRRAGPPELMQQETAFLQAMANTACCRITADGGFELIDAAGNSLAKLTRVPATDVK